MLLSLFEANESSVKLVPRYSEAICDPNLDALNQPAEINQGTNDLYLIA
jgi:hypothetical protein